MPATPCWARSSAWRSSFVLPASSVADARQALDRLTAGLSSVLRTMGAGLQQPWSTAQTEEWRRTARTVRERLVNDAVAAIDSSRESVRWNVRDRHHTDVVARYEPAVPRLERAAIGVSVIARGLDDHARLSGTTHAAMRSMGELFNALAEAIAALTREVSRRRERRTGASSGRGRPSPQPMHPRRIAARPCSRSKATITTISFRSKGSGSTTRRCSCRSTASSPTSPRRCRT